MTDKWRKMYETKLEKKNYLKLLLAFNFLAFYYTFPSSIPLACLILPIPFFLILPLSTTRKPKTENERRTCYRTNPKSLFGIWLEAGQSWAIGWQAHSQPTERLEQKQQQWFQPCSMGSVTLTVKQLSLKWITQNLQDQRVEKLQLASTLSKTKTGPGGAISNSMQYRSGQPLPLYLTLTRNFLWREGPTDFDQHPTFPHRLLYQEELVRHAITLFCYSSKKGIWNIETMLSPLYITFSLSLRSPCSLPFFLFFLFIKWANGVSIPFL